MKKAVKKVTKKEAAKPKGKAVAAKGKVPVIEFRAHDKNTEKTRCFAQLYLRGKKTPYRFEEDFEKYTAYYQKEGDPFEVLKTIKSIDIPEEYWICFETEIKLSVGQITQIDVRRKGKHLDIIYTLFLGEKEFFGLRFNPIRLYKKCFEYFAVYLKKNMTFECELNIDNRKRSYYYMKYEYSGLASGTFSDDSSKFPAGFESVLLHKIKELLEELRPSLIFK